MTQNPDPALEQQIADQVKRRLSAELQKRRLQDELDQLREELEAARQELDTANEEYQTALEEVRTTNEELAEKVREAEAAERDLDNLIRSTGIGTLFLDAGLRLRRFTPAAQALLHLIVTDLGRPLTDLALAADPQLLTDCRRVLAGEESEAREIRALVDRCFLRHVLPYLNQQERLGGVVVTYSEVTSLKKIQEALQESENRFREAFAHAPVGMVITDPQGRFLEANQAYCRMVGYEEEELRRGGFAFQHLTHPEDLGRNLEEHRRLLQGEIPGFFVEKRYRHRNGTIFWVRASATLLRGPEDQPLRMIGIVEDISARKKAEAALLESEERFRMVLENSLDAAYRRNLQTDSYDYVSPVIEQLTGLTAKEFSDLGLEEVLARIHPEDQAAVRREIARTIAGEQDRGHAEYRFRTRDTTYRWLSDRYRITRDSSGAPLYRVGIVRDITSQRQARLELEKTAEELKRSNRELEQFAYIASHDLQQPLRSITGFLDLLRRRYGGQLSPEADEFISFAVDGARRLHQLINDILTFSRVGTRAREPLPVQSRAVLSRALADLQGEIEASGAEITVGDLPLVTADDLQLQQLFQNLIANSLKYRRPEEPPRIHISAERAENGWRFAVQDNGIGLPPEYAERIFQIFQRLHSPADYPGTGIGLAICKKIVERHGGRIWVESEPGPGATFYFTLPRR